MRRVVSSLFLLCLAACGTGTGGGPPAPGTPVVLAINGPLAAAGGTAFTIRGAHFPGTVSDVVTVVFRAESGSPFGACTEDSLTQQALWESPTSIRGSSVADVFVGEVRCYVTVRFADGTQATSATPIATFTGLEDVALDHDLNGVHDRCDPNTYDFESDNPGQRPADMTQLNGVNAGFETATVDDDRVARYGAGTSTGIHDRFDRFRQDFPRQDVTAYVDFDATPSICSLEFWSEGSWSGSAGAGLILQVRSGLLYFFHRVWRSVPATIGPALPASGRIRVRLRKEAGTTSTMYVDAWENDAWTLDHAVFPVADDTTLRGLDTVMADYSAGSRGIRRITVVREVPQDALTLARTTHGITDWKLFQRDGNGEATLPVDVLYRAAGPARLEVRVEARATGLALPGHDFGDHVRVLPEADGGRAHVEVGGVPTGGNYDLVVRLVDVATNQVLGQRTCREIAVGDVYLAIGQSNMAGYSGSLAGATAPIPEVHLYGNDGRWKQAAEPMDAGTDQLDTVSREFPGHSLMLPFAKRLFETTGVPVAVIPGPLGGTNLYVQWQRNAFDPAHRVTLYGSALHRVRAQYLGAPLRGILWYQGESDAIAGRTTAQYRADLEQLVAQYRGDLSAPDALFLCVQLGTWSGGGFPHWTNVQEAQRRVCRADAQAALATVVDQPRSDGIHYSVAGYQELGVRLADQARVLVFGHAIDPLAELDEVAAVSGGTAIELRYDAPVSGGVPSLYAVSDDAGTPAVTGVTATGSTVTLQLDRALSTNARVRYGLSTLPAGGWVEDANGVPVPCFADVAVP